MELEEILAKNCLVEFKLLPFTDSLMGVPVLRFFKLSLKDGVFQVAMAGVEGAALWIGIRMGCKAGAFMFAVLPQPPDLEFSLHHELVLFPSMVGFKSSENTHSPITAHSRFLLSMAGLAGMGQNMSRK